MRRDRGWFLFLFRGRSDRVRREMLRAGLENVVEDGEWDKATCGDGVVDDGEDCDPGLLEARVAMLGVG